jgi:ATP-dependent DNA helicase RecQ
MLSCIYRAAASGISFGAGHIMDILRGKATEKVVQYGHDQSQHLRHGADLPTQWRVLRQLIASQQPGARRREAYNTLLLRCPMHASKRASPPSHPTRQQ